MSDNNIKYIRHKHTFLAFHKHLVHRDVAINFFGANALIHGAGFLTFKVTHNGVELDCTGKSESLRVSPRRDDAELVASVFIGDKPAKFVICGYRLVMFSSELDHEDVVAKVFEANAQYQTGLFTLVNHSGVVKASCTDFEGNKLKEATEQFNYYFVP